MELTTNRVSLRPHLITDAKKMNAWENDPILRRLSDNSPSPVPAEPLRRTRDFLKNAINSPDPGVIRLAICTREGRLIGYCMIAFIDTDNRSCKVGITIGDREEWGKGYAGDALKLVLKHCFIKLRMNRIGAEIYSFNSRSIAFFMRAGFKREGILRQAVLVNGRFYDEHLYGLLYRDWVKREHK